MYIYVFVFATCKECADKETENPVIHNLNEIFQLAQHLTENFFEI